MKKPYRVQLLDLEGKPVDNNMPLRPYLRKVGVADEIGRHPEMLRLTGSDKPRRKLKPSAKARKAKAKRGLIQLDPASPVLSRIRELVR